MKHHAYPRMLYRPGTSEVIWGHHVDTMIVDDADAEMAAAEDGWKRSPDPEIEPMDRDGDGFPGGSLPRKRGRPRKVADG